MKLAPVPDSLGYTDAQEGFCLIHCHHSRAHGDAGGYGAGKVAENFASRSTDNGKRETLVLPWVVETSKPTLSDLLPPTWPRLLK